MALFANVDEFTSDNENLFSYVVAAGNKEDAEIYLEVYYGPSGPSIGGLDGEEYDKVADELAKIIVEAEPADYEIENTYKDVGMKLIMGVKNGEPYYKDIDVFSEKMADIEIGETEV